MIRAYSIITVKLCVVNVLKIRKDIFTKSNNSNEGKMLNYQKLKKRKMTVSLNHQQAIVSQYLVKITRNR